MNKDITLEDLGYEIDKLETNEEELIYYKDILDKNTFGYFSSEVITFDLKNYNVDYDNIQDKTLTIIAIYNQCKELGWLDE